MKRVSKLSATIVLLFATIGAMGAEPKVTVDEARKSIVIELEEPMSENQIRLIDMENHIIYSERLDRHEVSAKKLFLTKLPIGDYILMIENDMRAIEYNISVVKVGVRIVSKEVDNKPIFRKKDGRVYLNLWNSDLNPVEIKVRDAMDRMLFSETMDGILDIQKAFNFKKAFAGSYVITVKDGKNIYTEAIEVK